MTFQLTAVKKKALKVDKQTILNFRYINSSDNSEDKMNINMIKKSIGIYCLVGC